MLGSAFFAQLALVITGAAPELPAGPLDGAWLQPCDTGALRLEVISNGHAALTEANYNDVGCTKPRIAVTSSGSITLGSGTLGPGAADHGDADFTFESVQLNILDPQFVALFNSGAICGFSDWAVNAPKDITGRSCDLFQTGHPVSIPKYGDPRYGIFSFSPDSTGDTSRATLFFGKLTPEQNGMTPQTRPTQLDPRGYERQLSVAN